MTLDSKFKEDGLKLLQMTTAGGKCCKVYLQDLLLVLEDQIMKTLRSETVTDREVSLSPSSPFTSHPMKPSLWQKACQSMKDYLKEYLDPNVYWRSKDADCEQSAVTGLQVFSNKAQSSLTAGALGFYLVHVTLLNVLEKQR